MSSSNSSSSPSSPHPALELLTLSHAPHPQWLDLPDYLSEKILERLPIVEYIRFAAVCRIWLSLQSSHRRRGGRSLNIPWFVPSLQEWKKGDDNNTLLCYSPFENKSFNIPLPATLSLSVSDYTACTSSLHNGWLVLDRGNYRFTLMNPISGEHIVLPGALHWLVIECKLALMPPPDWAVFANTQDRGDKGMYLARRKEQGHWIQIERPDWRRAIQYACDTVLFSGTCQIFWKGKFYYFHLTWGLMFSDPLDDTPVIKLLDMDTSKLQLLPVRWKDAYYDSVKLFLVESEEKMLLVAQTVEYDRRLITYELTGFKLFEANLSEKRWVRLESLGDDRVLFVYGNLAISLVASDVGVEGNCVYCHNPWKDPWMIYDLDTEEVTEATWLPCPPPASRHVMFVPSLHSYGTDSNACGSVRSSK